MKFHQSTIEEDDEIRPVTKAETFYYNSELKIKIDAGFEGGPLVRAALFKVFSTQWRRMSVFSRAPYMEQQSEDLERYERELKEKKDRTNDAAI